MASSKKFTSSPRFLIIDKFVCAIGQSEQGPISSVICSCDIKVTLKSSSELKEAIHGNSSSLQVNTFSLFCKNLKM